MLSTLERTKPSPTPAADSVAHLYVLQVRLFVDEAAMPATVNGRLSAARRTHLSRVRSSAGMPFVVRCALERHRVPQKRACRRAMIGSGVEHCSHVLAGVGCIPPSYPMRTLSIL